MPAVRAKPRSSRSACSSAQGSSRTRSVIVSVAIMPVRRAAAVFREGRYANANTTHSST